MRHEQIRSTPSFHGYPQPDTVFVVLNDSEPGMKGMEITHILLVFSFHYRQKVFSCVLINWFVHGNEPDRDTGMWTVELECIRGRPTFQVIEVETIARGAHLIPVYGTSRVPDQFSHHYALDSFVSFFVGLRTISLMDTAIQLTGINGGGSTSIKQRRADIKQRLTDVDGCQLC